MKRYINDIYRLMVMAVCCFAMNACHDDPFVDFRPTPGDGQGFTFTVSIPQLSGANLQSRGTAGDAIKEIGNLHIYVYDEDGGYVFDCGENGFINYNIDQAGNDAYPSFPYSAGEMNANANPQDLPENYWDKFKTLRAEQKTPRATFGLKDFDPEKGKKYQICVTANVDVPESSYQTLGDLKAFSVDWIQGSIDENNQMFGMFSTNNNDVECKDPIEFQPGINLHAWLVRCASKVTVAFNTTQLNDNVWIYLHNVTIHNVPKTCHLRYGNKAESDDDVYEKGESILYAPAGSNYDDAATDFDNWPVLTKGTGTYGSNHSEKAEAMFFYENLQGYGKDKAQQDSDDPNLKAGFVSYPESVNEGNYGWRDEKPQGTYIEVEAYYRSDVRGNEGKGKIIYRFQLGLDTFKDYNAFRNHHYKLTLNFRGNANDVDWHIDYQPESENHIYVPHPFYISYLYGEHVEMPITIDGKLTEGTKIIAEIVENNWKPADASPSIYWNGDVYSSKDLQYDGPWHGFLTLRPTNSLSNASTVLNDIPSANSQIIGRQKSSTIENINGFNKAYLMSYWYGGHENMGDNVDKSKFYSAAELEANEGMHIPMQGYREYETSNGTHIDGTKDNKDTYEIKEVQMGDKYRTHVYIPLYTRALFMVKSFGYSGANPFFGQVRKAVVKITCWVDETVNGETKSVKREQTCDVIQVRRIINPSGIYREAGNNQSFTVKLSHRVTETSNSFMPFASDGKWSAEIESGDAGFITLNGQQKIYGSTGEYIQFQVHFIPASLHKNRYAVILVKYHDYTCKHRIIVRQGYDPDELFSGDNSVKWHCFNLRHGPEKECESPIDPGSMFRFGNLDYAIDASCNTADQIGLVPATFTVIDKNGNEQQRSWSQITYEDRKIKELSNANVAFRQYFNSENKTRLANYDEWTALRDHPDMDYTFGICYDGSSASTSMTGEYAYNFMYKNENNTDHGMRGIFVYNNKDGRNMFLPIGGSGHGRRKDSGLWGVTEDAGALRYANRTVYMPISLVTKMPMFWNIKDNTGAIYWGFPDGDHRIDVWTGGNVDYFNAWDINFTTYDFNHFSNNAYRIDDNSCRSDAAFMRLVDE